MIAITQLYQVEVSFLYRSFVGSFSQKIVIFIVGVDKIVQAGPLPEIGFILQVIAQHIKIFRQIMANPWLYPRVQKRRKLGAGRPIPIQYSRLLKSHWNSKQADEQRNSPGQTNGTGQPQANTRGNGKACYRSKKKHTESKML